MVIRAKNRLPPTDYLAVLVHDLRNPLGAAMGNVSYVHDHLGPDQKDFAEALDDANDALRRMGCLVDELMTVSQYETGTLAVSLERVSVQEVFDATFRNLAREAGLRGVSLSVGVTTEIVVSADRALLGRALDNMLGWAIRQPLDTAQIELRAVTDGEDIEIVLLRGGTASTDEDLPRGLYVGHCIATAHGGGLRTCAHSGWPAALVLRLPKGPASDD